MEATPHTILRLKVDAAGRVLLPTELRNRHGIRQGDEVVLEEDDAGIRITTLQQAVRQAQDYFARLAPPGRLLSEELLCDRREEAARE